MGAEQGTRVSVVRPRLDAKPWGGRRLERFGLALPAGECIGEALVTAGEAAIVAGVAAGETLGGVVVSAPEQAVGEAALAAVNNRPLFPLLVKLIDASENLSIQVHPGDAQAASRDRLGKTEAWQVLAADDGAGIYAGLRDGVSMDAFREAAAKLDGSSVRLLRRMPATVGATILIPAGTVHALGAGVMVYEIQQPSDVTYRLDDWGRVDANGNSREMHLDAGIAVMRPEQRPAWHTPVVLPAEAGQRELLVACDRFALERVTLEAGEHVTLSVRESPQVVTLLEGRAMIGDELLDAGGSAVIWADSAPVALAARERMIALRGRVPGVAEVNAMAKGAEA